MPKANLRAVSGKFDEFKCTICDVRFAQVVDDSSAKLALFKKWDEHLYIVHRRQWNAQQRKKAKREADNSVGPRIVRDVTKI